ncbi:HAMP domain-containing sensor histidine kinase [uncultured Sphaerochaeta sp.]|uniref:sensor histidine kinase n=1 Tax=uncultured Sphaerochaeta sp. TaxID=886478 RepID=UPI002A0A29E3|nr:HAMP domain-containing sensor histidine kinase [uncultured Sphaerochaeta sp.]
MKGNKSRWMIVDGKEPVIVIPSLTFAFLVLIGLIVFLSSAIRDREELRMQSEAERSFNSVFLAMQDSTTKALKTMNDEKISGIGVYSSQGRKVLSLGNVPMTIPLEIFSSTSGKGDKGTGTATYNEKSGMIEYIRYSRLTILLDTGELTLSENGLLPSPIDFPDVLYILFDGQVYHHRLVMVKILGIISTLILIGLFFLVLSIYSNNRHYRETLAKQENLVNLGQAARTLTHEIKNPLSAITIQLALLKKILPKENLSDLVLIEQEVLRLTQLTNKVSDFLRNPLGTPVVVDLFELFSILIRRFDKPIKFTCVDHEQILIDADRARSVFENLLKNALESCNDRNPQVEVVISTDKRGSVHILVMDRGDGIKAGDEKKIFDPFFTTKIHGSGIGLSISNQFIKARGGNIRLYAREGGGTIAEVILPRSVHQKKMIEEESL